MHTDSNQTPRRRHPEWIRAQLSRTELAGGVRRTLAEEGLHTVCREARCPNRGECWDAGAATFLILGRACTRNCRYCSVEHAPPEPPDPDEPARVARAARVMARSYVVVTSVTRDDLPDGGASHFAAVVRALREEIPGARVELLVPDFRGDAAAALQVADSQPSVLCHNLETVRRLFPQMRPSGDYDRSLSLLRMWKRERPALTLKSGLMAGLGETRDEITTALHDLRAAGADIVTVGQYLQPARDCTPIARYLHPDEFLEIQSQALELGFKAAVCGPLVRSSYHAEQAADHAGS